MANASACVRIRLQLQHRAKIHPLRNQQCVGEWMRIEAIHPAVIIHVGAPPESSFGSADPASDRRDLLGRGGVTHQGDDGT